MKTTYLRKYHKNIYPKNSWLHKFNKTIDDSFWTITTGRQVDDYFSWQDLGDMTSATGIYFDLFLHLILSTNILKSMVTSVVNWYTVSLTKLTEFA